MTKHENYEEIVINKEDIPNAVKGFKNRQPPDIDNIPYELLQETFVQRT